MGVRSWDGHGSAAAYGENKGHTELRLTVKTKATAVAAYEKG